MSDNDDIEVESDADKRAHHNALERKRRDHIKDSFHSLRDSVPSLQGEKLICLLCTHQRNSHGLQRHLLHGIIPKKKEASMEFEDVLEGENAEDSEFGFQEE
nr:max protein [Rattus norvegicus]